MNAKFRRLFCTAALGVAMATAGVTAAQAQIPGAERLVGTWRITVTQHVCATGAVLGMPFQSLITFAPGGVMTETTANANFFPAERGPGHGVWGGLGGNNFRAESIALMTVNGALVKTQVITQGIKLLTGNNSFTSNAKVAFYDPSGALLLQGCATAVGHRFQ